MEMNLSPYPGRGVLIGRGRDQRHFWIYLITGRSEASRQRSLAVTPSSVLVNPLDPDTQADDLRHYACVTVRPITTVVGNGAHVDVIAERVQRGDAFTRIYEDLRPEPDPPIHTPRIAVAHGPQTWIGTVWHDGIAERRLTRRLEVAVGTADLITTYDSDGVEVRPASQVSHLVAIDSLEATLGSLWASLDRRYRVLAAGGYFDQAPTIDCQVAA